MEAEKRHARGFVGRVPGVRAKRAVLFASEQAGHKTSWAGQRFEGGIMLAEIVAERVSVLLRQRRQYRPCVRRGIGDIGPALRILDEAAEGEVNHREVPQVRGETMIGLSGRRRTAVLAMAQNEERSLVEIRDRKIPVA